MTESRTAPDWSPQSTAIDVPDGTERRGSTGQLFEARKGQWVRKPDLGSYSVEELRDLLGEAWVREGNLGREMRRKTDELTRLRAVISECPYCERKLRRHEQELTQ